jgi:BNR repeat-like domain
MRILADKIVFKNQYPNYRAQEATHPGICWAGPAGSPYLLCGFVLGQARTSPDRRLHVMRSDDRGATWHETASPLAPLNDGPTTAHAGIVMGQTSAGTSILVSARIFMASPESVGWDDAVAGFIDADAAAVRYTPDGTWGMPITMDRRRHCNEWAIPCGVPVALGDGRVVLPMERHTKVDVPDWKRKYHAFLIASTDDGLSWPEEHDTLNDPEQRLAYYDQQFAVLNDGRLLTAAWVHDVADDRTLTARCAWSDDGGRSWSAPHDTGIEGGPVSLLPLADGRLLAAYTRRTPPAGIRACLSEDGGKTWLTDEELVIWDDELRRVTGVPAPQGGGPADDGPLWGTMWGWTFGTPVPVAGHGRSVFVTFNCAEPDGVRQIRIVELEV